MQKMKDGMYHLNPSELAALIDPSTGTPLTPSFHGQECLGNGEHPEHECCCDECNYYLECFPEFDPKGE